MNIVVNNELSSRPLLVNNSGHNHYNSKDEMIVTNPDGSKEKAIIIKDKNGTADLPTGS